MAAPDILFLDYKVIEVLLTEFIIIVNTISGGGGKALYSTTSSHKSLIAYCVASQAAFLHSPI